MIKKWNIYLLTLLLLLGVTLPTAFQPAHAQLANQISGKVAAEIDPFLLLRNLARANPQAFQDVLDVLLNDNLYPIIDPLPPLIKDPILAEIEKRRQDPESFIDFLEEIVDTLAEPPLNIDLRAEIAKFLVIERDTILALIPNLPADLKNLLAGLLPETIDLNYLPLSGATLSVQNARGWTLGLAISSRDGSYSLKLPTGATQIKVSRVGYQPLLIDLMKVKALEAATDNLALFPDMIMMNPNSANLTARVYDGLRPVNNALVSVMTATNQPAGRTNRTGVSNIKGIQPLLPGLLGGLGLHKVMVDAEGYYLAEQTPLFLASNAQLWFNLTKAPPFGTLMGKVEVQRSIPDILSEIPLLEALIPDDIKDLLNTDYRSSLADVEIEVLNGMGNPILPSVFSDEEGEYRYPTDTIPIGSYPVGFTIPPDFGTGQMIKENVTIRAARETVLDACFSSLNGVVTTPNCPLGVCIPNPVPNEIIRVVDEDQSVVAEAATNSDFSLDPISVPGFYEAIGIPPGSYSIQFWKSENASSPSKEISGYVFSECEAKTENACFSSLNGQVGSVPCVEGICLPINNQVVRLVDEIGNPVAETSTNIAGVYHFGNLSIGDYKVQFKDPPIKEYAVSVAENCQGYMQNLCYSSLAGYVTDNQSLPLSGKVVSVVSNGVTIASANTVAGVYLITGIPPGTYTIEIGTTPPVTYSDYVIGDCEVKTQDSCYGVLTGVVTTNPCILGACALVNNGSVRVVSNGVTIASASTIAGVYVINGIPPGTYTIEFRKSGDTTPRATEANYAIGCSPKALNKKI